jgi:hypothetical protein
MSTINKITRGIGVLLIMLVLAILVWRFAFNSDYFYYSIGAAVAVTALAIFIVYRNRSSQQSTEISQKKPVKQPAQGSGEEGEGKSEEETTDTVDTMDSPSASAGESETIAIEKYYTDIQPFRRGKLAGDFKSNSSKPDAVDIAARYRQMASTIKNDSESEFLLPSIKAAASNQPPVKPGEGLETESDSSQEVEETAEATTSGEPPIPMIEDESVLTPEEMSELVNAVWYRCENPYCKYTSFLTIHHILDEKDGGTNKLDNLIVLCPYCHDLAHRNEMPEKEMSEWISNREDRFKFKPDWHYH